MGTAQETAACSSCGRPLGVGASGDFCLACLLMPAKNWLDRSAGAESAISILDEWQPGEKIDRYQLEERLGEGGFGIVYRALQLEPIHRQVALKVLKPRMASRDVVARFEGERQALAMMDHPNVARVYDAGTTFSGCPYFVMELVTGRPVTIFCRHLPLEDRLRVFLQTCRGVQHAHQKGLIHRDIKPSNVLVMGEGIISVAKVIDFGIAKALEQPLADKTIYTAQGQVMGTLQYMSPEQALSNGMDVDTRSDIYSLGVLLYEILTGVTPMPAELGKSGNIAEAFRHLRDVQPLRPSQELERQLRITRTHPAPALEPPDAEEAAVTPSTVRGDLDWIVMKALEKERARRYPAVADLMEDIERFLKQEPVQAKAPTARYRVAQFAQRNTALLRTIGTVAIILAAATTVTTWMAIRATRAEQAAMTALKAEAAARQEAAGQAARARHQIAALAVEAGERLLEEGDAPGALLWFAEATELDQGNARLENAHRIRFAATLRGAARLEQLWTGMADAEFGPDGLSITMTDTEGEVAFWQRDRSGQELPPLKIKGGQHGRILASFPNPVAGSLVNWTEHGILQLWSNGKATPMGAAAPPAASEVPPQPPPFARTPCGRWWAVMGATGLQVWDTVTLSPVGPPLAAPDERALLVDIDPSGSRVAAAMGKAGSGVRVWDARSGAVLLAQHPYAGPVSRLALSPDGKWLATVSGTDAGRLDVWAVEQASPLHQTKKPGGAILDCRFSPDSRALAVASHDAYARIYDVVSGLPLTETMAHAGAVHAVCFSADGRRLATAAEGRYTARIWDARTGLPLVPWIVHPTNSPQCRLSPDGQWLLTWGGDEKVLRLWHAPLPGPAAVTLAHGSRLRTALLAPSGEKAVSLGTDGTGILWDTRQPGKIASLQSPAPLVTALFHPDGTRLATGNDRGTVELWDMATGKRLPPSMQHGSSPVVELIFCPAGNLLLSRAEDGGTRFWNLKTAQSVPGLPQHWRTEADVAWDEPSGSGLAVEKNGAVHLVTVRDAPGAEFEVRKKLQLPALPKVLEFVRAGREVLAACGGREGFAQVWNMNLAQPTSARMRHYRLFDAALSPDGTRLATAGGDNRVRLWEVPSGECLHVLDHRGHVFRIRFSPKGDLLASCSDDGTARVWDVETGNAISPSFAQGSAVLSWSEDGTRLLTASASGLISIWDMSPATLPVADLHEMATLFASQRRDAGRGAGTLKGTELLHLWNRHHRQLRAQLASAPPPAD